MTADNHKTNGADANIYAERDHEEQGAHYLRHIDRMTVEGLHSKSAIAGELAHRDAEIAALRQQVQLIELCNNMDGLRMLHQASSRYHHLRLGHSLTVKCQGVTICTGPNYHHGYGEALDAAVDASMTKKPSVFWSPASIGAAL